MRAFCQPVTPSPHISFLSAPVSLTLMKLFHHDCGGARPALAAVQSAFVNAGKCSRAKKLFESCRRLCVI
jgi:hypothetical protein